MPDHRLVVSRPPEREEIVLLRQRNNHHHQGRRNGVQPDITGATTTRSRRSTVLHAAAAAAANINIMETEGTAKIAEAVALCQVNPDDVKIEWTSGRIIVTVSSGAVYLSSDDVLSEDDQELLRKSEEQYGPIDVVVAEEEEEDEDLVSPAASASAAQPPEDEDGTSSSSTAEAAETADDPAIAATVVASTSGVDIAALARAINQAFQGSVLAELYEIEVTTPGASDELSGILWQAYRGFDVIATYTHPKTNQVQTLEGRLIERTADHTILNLKGRLKKLDNGTVQSVKLPPAKKEPLSL
jgi:hypothetical protein